MPSHRVPVTILTGFLGSGKTTLLNRILSENHGKRIAVVENEYGEIGIDHALVINADEEVFEMSNGCICCTVRGDLIRVLGNLARRRDRFDYVLVETTGLADPGPVAQTFFMDEEIRSEFALDGIVTLVDAHHVQQQLGRSDECTEQIAFADVIVLNKTDLVSATELSDLEARIREMNRMARVLRAAHAEVPVSAVLDLAAFDLDRVLERRPTFLEPEYPFEWTGVFGLPAGECTITLDEGPDPAMQLVVLTGASDDEGWLREGAERCVRLYATTPSTVSPSERVPSGVHTMLVLAGPGIKQFKLNLPVAGRVALYAQHHASEFGLRVVAPGGLEVPPEVERAWVAQHEHDDEVGSVAIDLPGTVDPDRLNAWLGELLRERGVDIFRMKGFLNLAGEERRFVFQGVHMLIDGQPERPWGAAPRRNQLVFIGRNLDREAIREGFVACLA
jgi:G3E family GTPase